jgi:serine/threonine protein kinase
MIPDPQQTKPRDPVQSDAKALASEPPEPGVGTVLKGKYRLESQLGEGGMGVVYRAIDLEAVEATSLVAVKLIKPALRSEANKRLLYEEVEKTRTLQQENIVDVYGFEQSANAAFMVMEYLVGRPLDSLIAEQYALGMPLKLAWPIINGMGQGLAYAHRRGIIHSDFKPSNAFVTAVGTKVLDFGIARAVGGAMRGLTMAYASCDMLEGLPCDARDDVYAFGLVVYKLLSGKHPFCDPNGAELRATTARDERMTVAPIRGLTRRQHGALEGALCFDRAKRTKSIQEVLDGLERKGPPVVWWAAIGLLLLVIVAMGGLGAYRWMAPQDSDQAFIAHLITAGGAPPSADDAETAKQLNELGQQMLKEGVQPFDSGLLSENARPLSSALGVFQQVLKVDPGNLPAARGILAVANAYKAEAQRLYEAGQWQQADDMTQIALRIWPDSIDLKTLAAKIRKQREPAPPAAS